MKAWNDNFVTDTGTARWKGHNNGPFPFFSLTPFNSTSLFVGLCWQCAIFWCHPNVTQIDLKSLKKCFLICFCNEILPFGHFHFQFYNTTILYWRKEMRKDTFVFVLKRWCKSKRRERQRETERRICGKKRVFFMLNIEDNEKHRQSSNVTKNQTSPTESSH